MSRRNTRKLLLGIKEDENGEEKVTKSGVLRITKTLFIASWAIITAAQLYINNAFQLLNNPAYQSAILSTFLLTLGYFTSKNEVLKLVRQEDYLIEE